MARAQEQQVADVFGHVALLPEGNDALVALGEAVCLPGQRIGRIAALG